MKVTVEMDEKLLKTVKTLLGTPTTRDTVHASMEFVRRQMQLSGWPLRSGRSNLI